MKNKATIFRNTTLILLSIFTASFIFSCEPDLFRDDLPDSNSKPDTVLPEANFTYTADEVDFTIINFQDLSSESNTYFWEFGGGVTSTEQDPTYAFPGEGTYPVTLTSSDSNGASSTITLDVIVVEPEEPEAIIPDILEPSFEDNSLPDGTGDGRDSWRNSDLGGVIQINTSSTVPDGGQAAKFPSSADRIGYQEVEVTPNTDYRITYTYRLENAGGTCTVAILAGGGFTDTATANAATIESFTGSELSYTTVDLLFNSGANNIISIFITNTGEEARVDNFIAELQ
ncbi:PKD domain-containing protein [Lacinutrix chionoecetis]